MEAGEKRVVVVDELLTTSTVEAEVEGEITVAGRRVVVVLVDKLLTTSTVEAKVELENDEVEVEITVTFADRRVAERRRLALFIA